MSAYTTFNTNNTFNFINSPATFPENHIKNSETTANYNNCSNKKDSSNFPRVYCQHTTDVSSTSSKSVNEESGSILMDGLCCGRSNRSDSFEKKVPEQSPKNYVNEMVQIINYSPDILRKVQVYNRLCKEVQDTETAIEQLLQAKNSKTSNIDDLRCLIRRVASEDTFSSCCFVGKSSRNFLINCSSRQQKQEQKENGSAVHSRSIQSSSDLGQDTTTATESSAPGEADGEAEPRGDKANHGCFNNYYHFDMCSLYWQDVLPSSLPFTLSHSMCK